MRLPHAAHTSRPWRIHEVAYDFRLEDVWRLPTPGGADDFSRLVEMITAGHPAHGSSRALRLLVGIREKLGKVFGWDDAASGLGSRAPTLGERIPTDLRDASPPAFGALPFSSLYLTEDEFAAELANRTMHGILHLGWVEDEPGAYRGQMAVLVKPNGVLGKVYMAAIKPFRYLIVYPALMRRWARTWHQHLDDSTAVHVR